VDVLTKEDVQEYAAMLCMSDKQLEEQNEIDRKFRELFQSVMKQRNKEQTA
jgi:hypothetical protein